MSNLESIKNPVAKVPPPLLFLLFLLVGGACELYIGGGYLHPVYTIHKVVALLISITSGYLALHALLVLKEGKTPVSLKKQTTKIIDGGPFRFTRNPMYLSLVLLLFSLTVLFLSICFLLAAIFLWFVLDQVFVKYEEKHLYNQFGGGYMEYKSKVRRWF